MDATAAQVGIRALGVRGRGLVAIAVAPLLLHIWWHAPTSSAGTRTSTQKHRACLACIYTCITPLPQPSARPAFTPAFYTTANTQIALAAHTRTPAHTYDALLLFFFAQPQHEHRRARHSLASNSLVQQQPLGLRRLLGALHRVHHDCAGAVEEASVPLEVAPMASASRTPLTLHREVSAWHLHLQHPAVRLAAVQC